MASTPSRISSGSPMSAATPRSARRLVSIAGISVASGGRPLVCVSGCSMRIAAGPRAFGTRSSGRCLDTGSSTASRPRSCSWRTATAVNDLLAEPMPKTVSGVISRPASRSRRPNARRPSGRPSAARATAMPGTSRCATTPSAHVSKVRRHAGFDKRLATLPNRARRLVATIGRARQVRCQGQYPFRELGFGRDMEHFFRSPPIAIPTGGPEPTGVGGPAPVPASGVRTRALTETVCRGLVCTLNARRWEGP